MLHTVYEPIVQAAFTNSRQYNPLHPTVCPHSFRKKINIRKKQQQNDSDGNMGSGQYNRALSVK